MKVRSELKARRLVIALAATLVLPTTLAVAAARYESPEAPPEVRAPSHAPLAQTPGEVSKAQGERNVHALRVARKLTAARLVAAERLDPPLTGPARDGALPTLALAPRDAPWTLAELTQSVPEAFTRAGDALVVGANITVPRGATLNITADTPDVRLISGGDDFATLISRGALNVVGTPETEVSIASFDPATQDIDTDPADGRSFVQQIAGRMDVTHARFDGLGFGTGTTSGVAWKGINSSDDREKESVQGDVTSSTFTRSWFGVYTMEAHGMRFIDNEFVDNDLYGFDPHDFSDEFVVARNVAHGNGKHGFIFSRGCNGNLLQDNLSYDNGGHGFMIDDGRTESVSFAEARLNTSNDNQLIGNVARDNAGSGIEIEGGTGNLVTENRLEGNYVGVRLKDSASATVTDNEMVGNTRYGVDVLPTSKLVSVTDNSITDSWAGVNIGKRGVATVEGNAMTEVSAPTVVEGQASRHLSPLDKATRYLQWNPVLVLWGLILGVPLLVGGIRSLMGLPLLRRVRRDRVALPG